MRWDNDASGPQRERERVPDRGAPRRRNFLCLRASLFLFNYLNGELYEGLYEGLCNKVLSSERTAARRARRAVQRRQVPARHQPTANSRAVWCGGRSSSEPEEAASPPSASPPLPAPDRLSAGSGRSSPEHPASAPRLLLPTRVPPGDQPTTSSSVASPRQPAPPFQAPTLVRAMSPVHYRGS